MSSESERKVIVVVKKKGGHGGHHGGAWKVAYADFVTAMMAFFLVMWIISMDQASRDKIQGYFQDPVGFRDGGSSGASLIGQGATPVPTSPQQMIMSSRTAQQRRFAEIADRIRDKLSDARGLDGLGNQVDVVLTDEGLRIELVEDADGETFFAFGSSQLKPAAGRLIGLIAPELVEVAGGMVIEGHTDAVRFGRPGYTNWELSADRANAARRALEASGYPADQVEEVRGHADRDLRVPSDPFDNSNRRISLLVPFRFAPVDALMEVGRRAASLPPPDEPAAAAEHAPPGSKTGD